MRTHLARRARAVRPDALRARTLNDPVRPHAAGVGAVVTSRPVRFTGPGTPAAGTVDPGPHAGPGTRPLPRSARGRTHAAALAATVAVGVAFS